MRRAAAAGTALLILCMALIASCASLRTRTGLIHKPHAFDPVAGRKPMLFVQITPQPSDDYMLVVNTPEGEAYLTVGAAVRAAYVEALGAYFDVDTRRAKYSDYVAFLRLDGIELRIEPTGPQEGRFIPSRLSYRHEVPIHTLRGDYLETLVVEGAADARLDATDYLRYMRGVAMAVEDILYEAEPAMLEHFRAKGRHGDYRLR